MAEAPAAPAPVEAHTSTPTEQADAQNTTAIPETAAAPETEPQVRNREVISLGSTVLNRARETVNQELAGKTKAEREQILADPQKKALRAVSFIGDQSNGSYQDLKDGLPGINVVGENDPPIIVTITNEDGNREQVQVTRIMSGDDEEFLCKVISPGEAGRRRQEKIKRADLVNAQLIAEADAVSQNFSGAEQQVVQAYIDVVSGNQDGINAIPTEDFNATMQEVATKNGIVTVDDARKLLAKSDNATPAQRQAAEQLLAGKNLLTHETTMELFKVLGCDSENLQKLAAAAREDGKNDIAAQLEKAAQAVSGEGIEKFFKASESGELKAEQGQKVAEAFRSGNINAAIEAMCPDAENGNQQAQQNAAELKKTHEYLKNAGIGAGMLTLIFAFMAYDMIGKMQK